jgi:hypothetical protein
MNPVHQRLIWLFASLAASLATPAFAHHSAGNITAGMPIKWQGVISKISWDGAHVMYRVDVVETDGAVRSWQVLGGSPRRLAQRGIMQQTLHKGDSITVAGYLNTSNRMISPVYVSPNDGRKLFVGYFTTDEQFIDPELSAPR